VAIKSFAVLLFLAAFAFINIVEAFNPELMLQLVNNERKKAGRDPLVIDNRLKKAAQLHTDFMVRTNTLTHDDEAGDLGQRIKAQGFTFATAGENIAQGFGTNEEKRVMDAWMDSQGHRENILGKDFTHFGVGFGGGTFWTQVFGRPLDFKPSTPTPTPSKDKKKPNTQKTNKCSTKNGKKTCRECTLTISSKKSVCKTCTIKNGKKTNCETCTFRNNKKVSCKKA